MKIPARLLLVLLIGITACTTSRETGTPETSGSPPAVERISPATFLATYTPEAIVIDVRTPEEYAQSHLKNAVNMDVQGADFQAKVGELDPEKTYYLYCRTGNRSNRAGTIMKETGIKNILNIGGLAELIAAGVEVEE